MVVLDLHVRRFCAPVLRGGAALVAEQAGGSCAWCLALAVGCSCRACGAAVAHRRRPRRKQPACPRPPLCVSSACQATAVPASLFPLFSPPQALAREFLHNAYQVLIGSPDLKANHRITQIFDFPAEHEKYHKLVRILEKVRRSGSVCHAGLFCRPFVAGSLAGVVPARPHGRPPAPWASRRLEPPCISPRCQPCARRPAGDGWPPHPHLLRNQEGVRRGDPPAAHGRLARTVHPRRQVAARARLGARGLAGWQGRGAAAACGLAGRQGAGHVLHVPLRRGACRTATGSIASVHQLTCSRSPTHVVPQVLAEFKAGKHPIMIATDVAARGLGASPGAALCHRGQACCLRPAWPRRWPAASCLLACRSSSEGS